ncbi:hypothetical protein L5515_002593 [Caenorhabditis briggsae]|uniref:Roadblock/LC7 domain-containing protein n=1 Tax=Caenorhabditis briggsae TaxID=6238 RepID=A0AAE9J4H6_CAEBR|nr:hypothetical protein L5515_002593 [Caenorhabditis briggsae]
MSENLQDLEDYIQYQFEDFKSFKLALFLNSGQVSVKFSTGEIDKNFIDNLISEIQTKNSGSFHLENREFSLQTSSEKLLEFKHSESEKIFALKNGENLMIVYCSGSTVDKDQERIKELIMDLFN